MLYERGPTNQIKEMVVLTNQVSKYAHFLSRDQAGAKNFLTLFGLKSVINKPR